MVEEFLILDHGLGIKNRINGGIDLVFQRKDVPADLAVRVFEHTSI